MSKVDVKRVVEHVRNNIRTGSPVVLSPAEAIALFGGGKLAGQSVVNTEEFEEKCRSGYYRCELPYGEGGSADRRAYREKQSTLSEEFDADLRTYLLAQGVPERYVAAVAHKAYEDGHSSGYEEVLCEAMGLVDIFQ